MHFQDELTIDMTHFSGEGWGITEEEIDACKERIREAALSVERLRKSGKGPDGSLVLFPHLPYLLEEEILISKEERERLLALSKLAKEQDIVVSIGIGGSYLGNQVLFDLFCGQYWNLMTKEERHGYPQLYFAGQNLDPVSFLSLVDRIRRSSQTAWWKHKVLLVVNSKSGTTLEPVMAERALREMLGKFCEVSVIAVTDKE